MTATKINRRISNQDEVARVAKRLTTAFRDLRRSYSAY